MIDFEKFTLHNGLSVIVHKDPTTPIVAVNTLYKVGARNESPNKTGFAHLFEHLMFGGSVNIPNFDNPLQRVGGSNNAFTNNDYTNYYITVPRENLETAFWLESDRMLSLAFTPESLEVQRKVVIEEFKQRYLNQPYGDAWLHLRPLAYKNHPYRWATIGRSVADIENATLDEVKDFFKRYYHPGNAVLVVAGNVEVDNIRRLVEKWYGDIPAQPAAPIEFPSETDPPVYECLTLDRKVPQKSIYLAWPMCDRFSPAYHATDLTSDVLSQGKSSRLYQSLVREKKLFTSISCFIMGSLDPGLIVITGMFDKTVEFDQAKEAILSEVERLIEEGPAESELEKVKNILETSHVLSEVNVLNKAMSLAYFELLGDASEVNREMEKYRRVTPEDIRSTAQEIFDVNAMKELRYNPL